MIRKSVYHGMRQKSTEIATNSQIEPLKSNYPL